MFEVNPVFTSAPVSNLMEVRVIAGDPNAQEITEGMVAGIYSHGVPDFEEWLGLFMESFDKIPLEELGVIKSFGGQLIGESAWIKENKNNPPIPAHACVMHIFKDANAKAQFDVMFDPTAGMFKALAVDGTVLPPFKPQNIGPIWDPIVPAMSQAA